MTDKQTTNAAGLIKHTVIIMKINLRSQLVRAIIAFLAKSATRSFNTLDCT